MNKLADVQKRVETIGSEVEELADQINRLDEAINSVDSPDDAAILASVLHEKIEEFEILQQKFANVLEEYNMASKLENKAISFTAHKLLKAVK